MERDIHERAYRLARTIATLNIGHEYRDLVRRNIIRQLVRASMSVGANLAEAAAAQSKADFVAKASIARKEARETNYWLRLAEDLDVVPRTEWATIRREAMAVSQVIAAIARSAQRSDRRGASS